MSTKNSPTNRVLQIFIILTALTIPALAPSAPAAPAKKVLIVMDEREQMEVLAEHMKTMGYVK